MLAPHRYHRREWLLGCMLAVLASGCTAIPDVTEHATYHNPFPQLHRVAVLPFYNQSKEPTVDGDAIAIAYFGELQQIPGFEVMPVGVAKQVLLASGVEPRSGADFQRVAQMLGVDAVIVGSITEYSPYYPPRIGLSVDWYAANPGFHPIPAGYGLPWGTAEEEYIPESLKQAAEFELAREQLATQTPEIPVEPLLNSPTAHRKPNAKMRTAGHRRVTPQPEPELLPTPAPAPTPAIVGTPDSLAGVPHLHTPGQWPDPRGFVPAGPAPLKPPFQPQFKPVMTHTRLYDGKDSEFTEQLSRYVYRVNDARFGGWESYLQRPEDFIRFCCRLHITETLAARGGVGKTEVIVRWPVNR